MQSKLTAFPQGKSATETAPQTEEIPQENTSLEETTDMLKAKWSNAAFPLLDLCSKNLIFGKFLDFL